MSLVDNLDQPFTINVTWNNGNTELLVTPIDEYFRVTKPDMAMFIADLLPNDVWYQMQLAQIDQDLMDAITLQTERHCD